MDEEAQWREALDAAWEEVRQARVSVSETEGRRDAALRILWQMGLKMQTTGLVDRESWEQTITAQLQDRGEPEQRELLRRLLSSVRAEDQPAD